MWPFIRSLSQLAAVYPPKNTWFSVHMCSLFQSESCDITLPWYNIYQYNVNSVTTTYSGGVRVKRLNVYHGGYSSTMVPLVLIEYHGMFFVFEILLYLYVRVYYTFTHRTPYTMVLSTMVNQKRYVHGVHVVFEMLFLYLRTHIRTIGTQYSVHPFPSEQMKDL